MRQAILNRIDDFSERMKLHYALPNQGMVVEILQMDASTLSDVHSDLLSQYIFVLGQYIITLQYNENLKNIDYMLTSKSYEAFVNKAIFTHNPPGKTEKARRGWVLDNVEGANELYAKVLEADAEKMLISGMCKAAEGLSNALKKEYSGRTSYAG